MMGQEKWEVLEYLNQFVECVDDIAFVRYYDLNGIAGEGNLDNFLNRCIGLAPTTTMDLFEYVVTYDKKVMWREE